jgi:LytS/YehU family sensor histidine kinase
MNPHFILLSLNAIQECIITKKQIRLLNTCLNFQGFSACSYNSEGLLFFKHELEMRTLYLSLETLRFRQSFTYCIDVTKGLTRKKYSTQLTDTAVCRKCFVAWAAE